MVPRVHTTIPEIKRKAKSFLSFYYRTIALLKRTILLYPFDNQLSKCFQWNLVKFAQILGKLVLLVCLHNILQTSFCLVYPTVFEGAFVQAKEGRSINNAPPFSTEILCLSSALYFIFAHVAAFVLLAAAAPAWVITSRTLFISTHSLLYRLFGGGLRCR